MKKSTLLSLLTAGSIVLTSAGTYAAWDSIETKTTHTGLTFREPVVVSVNQSYDLQKSPNKLGETPTASGNVEFTIDNPGDLATTLTLTPTITGDDGATTNDFTIKIKEKDKNYLQGDAGAGFTDTITSKNKPTYTVEVTPKDETQHKSKTAGKAVKVELKAELS